MTKVVVKVPDIGGAEDAEVIEMLIATGDNIEIGRGLIVLESDKASMEIPSDISGMVKEIFVVTGDLLSEGSDIASIEIEEKCFDQDSAKADEAEDSVDQGKGTDESVSSPVAPRGPSDSKPDEVLSPAPGTSINEDKIKPPQQEIPNRDHVYAGPAVRKLARQFGIELTKISGSGPGGRIVKEDLHEFAKKNLSANTRPEFSQDLPDIDFSKWGKIERINRSRIERLTAENMHRSWTYIPHVTHFDDADITDLERFRAELQEESTKRNTKLTLMPFLLKAVAIQLRDHPDFNASLAESGKVLVKKHYINIGIAVDTPEGLFVPVIRDVERKALWELAEEVADMADRARTRKLRPEQMQGGCFTISSLGRIGGKGFTPIVNSPELAILGVGKSDVRPVWDGSSFKPHTMLPLSLSYDHRAINGALAGRFATGLVDMLADVRRLIL